jgi:hypothetical protein
MTYGYVNILKRDDSRERGGLSTKRHKNSPHMSELFDWDRAIVGLKRILKEVYDNEH